MTHPTPTQSAAQPQPPAAPDTTQVSALALAHGPPTAAARLLRPPPPEAGTETGQPYPHTTGDGQLRWLPAEVAVYTRSDGPHASYIAWANPDGTHSLLALSTRRILDTATQADARSIADAAESHLGRPPIDMT